MIELERHIETLLLDNDCVIVPNFGGFVVQQSPARYNPEDHTMQPPRRLLGFNPQLRINDSLLVQSYINTFDISYPEALRRIEEEVGMLQKELHDEGCYTLEGLGTLTINGEGNIEFEPGEAGILSPIYYGLGMCQFLTLKDAREQKETTVVAEIAPSETTATPPLLEFIDNGDESADKEFAIRIKMSWVRNTVAVAAAVIAFFLMVTPVTNSDLSNRTMSNLQNSLIARLMPKDSNVAPATPVAKATLNAKATPATETKATETATTAEATVETAKASEAPKPETQVSEAPKPETSQHSPSYCVVLASHVRLANAEEYVKDLKKRGVADAEVYVHKNVVRVICGSYPTEGAAYGRLNKISDTEEFCDAWVMKKAE